MLLIIKPVVQFGIDTPMQPYRFCKFTGIGSVLTLLLTCCALSTAIADTGNIRIVTDIAPIHSLVSMIVGQQANVDLLVPPSQSPHSFSLKPSQIRTLNQAGLIVILGDNFTPALSRHLKSIDKKAVVLQLNDTIGEQHSENKTDDHTFKLTHAPSAHLNDPHTWLNPDNAIVWLDAIAHAVIQLDEQNLSTYQNNVKRSKAELAMLHREFAQQLSAVKSAPYVVYHDAYQHFANSYGLQKPIAIALSDARAPGARKLREMRAHAIQSTCVFSELLHDDIIVDTVTAGLPVRRATLDPMGSTLPIGPNHYPQMMRALVNNFVACLG